MAITGRFVADFSSFQSAVQQAEVSLRSFETGAGKVEASLNKMADSLSGRKIVQDAALMAEAVERIGGVSKLTESELSRVSSTAAEAAAKMKAMGIDVPPGIAAIASHAKTATGAFSDMGSVVRNLAGAFGIAFTAGAVVQFGREVLQAGDAIKKMSDQTGLSVQEVQKLQYIAGQTSTPVQSLVGAIQNLQQRLGDDSTGATGAIKKLGLNFEEFNKLSTYEQMTTLSEGIRRIEDPTQRASVAAALFGKTWKELLPAVVAGMRELGNEAPIMSDAAVKALDDAGDALARLKNQATVAAGTMVENFEKVFAVFKGDFSNMGTGLKAIGADLNGVEGALAKVPPPALAVAAGFKGVALSAFEASQAEKELNESVRESIELHKKEAVELQRQTDEMQRLTDAQQANIDNIADKLFGIDDIKRATDYAEAIGRVENIAGLSATALEDVAKVALAGVTALVAAGRGTDDLTSKLIELHLAATATAREAAAAFQLMEQQATAAAAAAQMAAAFTAQGAALAASIAASGTGVWTSDMAIPAAAKSPNIWSAPAGMVQSSPGGIRPMAGGGPTMEGPAYLHNNEYVVPSGGALVRGGGGGTTVIQLVVDGRVLADVVNEQNTRTMKVGRKWPAS